MARDLVRRPDGSVVPITADQLKWYDQISPGRTAGPSPLHRGGLEMLSELTDQDAKHIGQYGPYRVAPDAYEP